MITFSIKMRKLFFALIPVLFAPLLEDPFLGDWEAELGDGWISHVTFEDNQDYKEYEYEKSTPESRRNVISGKWYYLSDTKNTYNIEYEKDGELKYRTITIDVNEERTRNILRYVGKNKQIDE